LSAAVDIRPDDLRTMRSVLARVLPGHTRVWVFGSRAGGVVRRASDLDLAIDAGRRLEPGEAVALVEAFEESDLPYGMDTVDLWSITAAFAALIEANRAPLPIEDATSTIAEPEGRKTPRPTEMDRP
jgi:predicted nucleotidyltransferase